MDIYNALFASLVLILAFAGIVWGLRVFKIFLVFLGLWSGFLMGMFIGDFLLESTQNLYLWGIGGAVICGLLAWPLQRIFVFAGMGLLIGFLVFATVMSRGGEPQTGLIAGATVFFVAGFISVMIYDYFIIIMMALASAYLIINICYLPVESRSLMEMLVTGQDGIVEAVGQFGTYYSELIWTSIVVLAILSLFAIYMQKILPDKRRQDDPEKKLKRGLAWKTTFVYAVIIAGFALLDSLFGLGESLIGYHGYESYYAGLSTLTPGSAISGFCHSPILNMGPVSFPLAAFVSFTLMKLYGAHCLTRVCRGNRWINGWVIGLILGIVVLPFIQAVVLFAVNRFEQVGLAGSLWIGFYKSFFDAPTSALVLKWIYVLALYPLTIALIIPTPNGEKKAEKTEGAFNYCI